MFTEPSLIIVMTTINIGNNNNIGGAQAFKDTWILECSLPSLCCRYSNSELHNFHHTYLCIVISCQLWFYVYYVFYFV